MARSTVGWRDSKSGIDGTDNLTNSGHRRPRGQAKYEDEDAFADAVHVVFLLPSPVSLDLLSLYLISSFIKLNFAVSLAAFVPFVPILFLFSPAWSILFLFNDLLECCTLYLSTSFFLF